MWEDDYNYSISTRINTRYAGQTGYEENTEDHYGYGALLCHGILDSSSDGGGIEGVVEGVGGASLDIVLEPSSFGSIFCLFLLTVWLSFLGILDAHLRIFIRFELGLIL